MREIKFRGFSRSLNSFVFGALIDMTDKDCLNLSAFFRRELNGDIEATTISQYTGLKDKNGKEIYEGDIVTHEGIEYEKYSCLFQGGKFQFHELSSEWIGTIHEDDLGAYCKVIGNIYENSELLRG